MSAYPPTGLAIGPVGVWLEATLKGDAQLMALIPGGVHEGRLPDPSTYPAVVHAHSEALPLTTVDRIEVWEDIEYFIRAEDKGPKLERAIAIGDRIKKVLLAAVPGPIAGGELMSVEYKGTLPVAEDYAAGEPYPKLVTRWAIKARAL